MRPLISILLAIGFVAPSMAQHPSVFKVTNTAVGTRRIPTRFFLASGRWSNANEHVGPLSTEIHCYKALGFCKVASAEWGGSDSFVRLGSFEISHWDGKEILAVDNSYTCAMIFVRVDFARESVTISSTSKNARGDGICKNNLDKIEPASLLGGNGR